MTLSILSRLYLYAGFPLGSDEFVQPVTLDPPAQGKTIRKAQTHNPLKSVTGCYFGLVKLTVVLMPSFIPG